jgi:tetratricopeptide (TPR) repeat protein
VDEAGKVVEELKLLIDNAQEKYMVSMYFLLKGVIEFEREAFVEARENLEHALTMVPHYLEDFNSQNNKALYYDALAQAYFEYGDLDKAQEEFERITALTLGRREYGDVYAKSFYMLGKIYEEKGWEGKAIEGYEKFIELWKDCDPEFRPMVDEAKQQVLQMRGKTENP